MYYIDNGRLVACQLYGVQNIRLFLQPETSSHDIANEWTADASLFEKWRIFYLLRDIWGYIKNNLV